MSARVRRPRPPAHASPARGRGIDPTPHIGWAKGIAVRIGEAVRLYGVQNRLDLEQTALLALCEAARDFDPTKAAPGANPENAFLGYAKPRVKWAVIWEARRLRTAGLFHSYKKLDRLVVAESGSTLDDDDDPWDVTDTRDGPPAPDPPLVLLGSVKKRDAGRFQ